MTLVSFSTTTIILILLAAGGYSLATIGMKLGSVSLGVAAVTLMALGLVLAAAAEVVILRTADLGIVYISILAIETLIVLSFAAFIGEGLNLRQISGAAVVVAGLAIVSH